MAINLLSKQLNYLRAGTAVLMSWRKMQFRRMVLLDMDITETEVTKLNHGRCVV